MTGTKCIRIMLLTATSVRPKACRQLLCNAEHNRCSVPSALTNACYGFCNQCLFWARCQSNTVCCAGNRKHVPATSVTCRRQDAQFSLKDASLGTLCYASPQHRLGQSSLLHQECHQHTASHADCTQAPNELNNKQESMKPVSAVSCT